MICDLYGCACLLLMLMLMWSCAHGHIRAPGPPTAWVGNFFFWNTVQRRCPHTKTHQYEFTHVHPILWAPLKIESAYVDIDEVAVGTSLSMSTLSTTEKIINCKCKHPVKATWVAKLKRVESLLKVIFDGSADFHNSPSLMGRLIFTIVSVLITTRIKHCF